jgi:hypothetical protein
MPCRADRLPVGPAGDHERDDSEPAIISRVAEVGIPADLTRQFQAATAPGPPPPQPPDQR